VREGIPVAEELDDLDRRLLHRLAEEVRPDLVALAGEIGTTPGDADERYQRLRGTGVITECAARVEPAAVGILVTAFVVVHLASSEHGAVVRRMLADLEQVEEAHVVDSGDHDWLLKVRASSSDELDTFLTERLALVPGFVAADTYLVLDTACEWINADRVRPAGW
jgi:Lrp/AsnC family leucine-responsive transcriptional regulator